MIYKTHNLGELRKENIGQAGSIIELQACIIVRNLE